MPFCDSEADIQMKKMFTEGEHRITIPPLHDEIAKGTLNDIITKVSQKNCITKEELVNLLR